ncbi:2Fe-2S iron-sulfur cluster-binding protein [Shimia thalassica]|uniref:2Fe-2S iron-sulfur cluster-binding protein n=1 Tax=Shimia thalassica TaxID=1715693 RepID=UPI001C0A1FB9|nr:2Fe-2S iron-sulfur cluster-binding protein [Shimia thalassica]MBU2943433.1 2Fe-2S iron-sulfur cluster binding domain-containing protein [Shimia thalassica]MDO6484513.1 2Fe-2S iron-sulfur cluster-binding protein [Shimia thalassica]MDO6501503.1 2Fe-2S iron-sulfur cluster-binding protein [Shimia thalassica]MDO6797705.1 2Fe-2S iron-sulfur cluster-binding protein [Shimia thalassica]MDP2493473.1 2Fe-2S iron-sulfur cluster-binding protein [Shimia thalassica]
MARFHDLEVTDIQKTIRDAVVVTLKPVNGAAEAFDFTQGQYLTFRQDFDGDELRRSYSICAGKDDGILQVGIKRVDGGTFSTWANEDLKIGDTVQAMPPMGGFFTALDAGNEKNYLGFAGGSGITPVLSILKTTLAAEPNSTFTLVYANKGVNTIMFREELEDLKNTYMGRFNVIHILETDAQEIDLFTGLVTEEKCAQLFATGWIDIGSVDTAFICGPEPMMLGIAAALRTGGLTDAQIKFELFASSQPGRAKRKAVSKNAASGANQASATITLDGSTQAIEMPKDTTILDAALDNKMDAPFACKAGVCSTCRCRVLEGEVEMVSNHALEDYEVEKGYVLSCQSYPVTDNVVVDFDQ